MGMEDAVIDATSTAEKMSNDTMSSLQEQEDTIKKRLDRHRGANRLTPSALRWRRFPGLGYALNRRRKPLAVKRRGLRQIGPD